MAASTSWDLTMRRLARDAPGLHAEVVAGRISAHRAMVEAGLRAERFTVFKTSADAVAGALRRNLPAEMLAEVVGKLRV